MTKVKSEICATAKDTRAHARQFTRQTKIGTLILLQGELGAGKTEWVKGLAEGLNCPCEVTSPTFTLVHEYSGGQLPLFHWDFYRLEPKTDLSVFDPGDSESRGITVIEWSEKFPGKWPDNAVRIFIEILPDEKRKITIE